MIVPDFKRMCALLDFLATGQASSWVRGITVVIPGLGELLYLMVSSETFYKKRRIIYSSWVRGTISLRYGRLYSGKALFRKSIKYNIMFMILKLHAYLFMIDRA